MYFSTLLINVGGNPDRPRPGRLWLRNVYRVHQRLCMGFPSARRKGDDAEMLQPFVPGDFAARHVHVARNGQAGFLFRVDPHAGGRVAILVLSALRPDWDYAFHNARYLLAAPPSEPRPLQLTVEAGQLFRFRLLANPVFRARRKSMDAHGKPLDAKWERKRVPVPGDEASLRNWLERRAERAGFALKQTTLIQSGFVYFNKNRESKDGRRLRSARYEGVLEVTDPDMFRAALSSGIGPAKAFGFGLLSLAPVP